MTTKLYHSANVNPNNQNSCFRIPELAINPLGDRIVHAFFYESKKGEEEKVDFKVRDDLSRTLINR